MGNLSFVLSQEGVALEFASRLNVARMSENDMTPVPLFCRYANFLEHLYDRKKVPQNKQATPVRFVKNVLRIL